MRDVFKAYVCARDRGVGGEGTRNVSLYSFGSLFSSQPSRPNLPTNHCLEQKNTLWFKSFNQKLNLLPIQTMKHHQNEGNKIFFEKKFIYRNVYHIKNKSICCAIKIYGVPKPLCIIFLEGLATIILWPWQLHTVEWVRD